MRLLKSNEQKSLWVRCVFVSFVLLQLLAPLSYYLRDDPYDERFAWRMFSAIRLYQCQPQVFEYRVNESAPERLDMYQHIHHAWVGHLKRNRLAVIEALLDRRCSEPRMQKVVLRNHCVNTDGVRIEPIVYSRLCGEDSVALNGGGE